MGKSISQRLYARHHPSESVQKRLARRKAEAARPNAAERGYDAIWKALRDQHIARHRRCVKCGRPATHVDHVIPHRGDDGLRLNPSNLQSLCANCHSSKTASRDGGFGNRRK